MRSSLPGGATPQRRLPVTPDLVRSTMRGHRPRLPSAFPLAAPDWPDSVPRPAPKRTLGVDYDTDWARRYPARVARLLLHEAVTRPLIRAVAAPSVGGTDRLAHLDEPVIFAANHASHLDTPLLLSVIPEPWRHRLVVAGAADYFFDTRTKAATFALLLNTVPIERTRVHRASAKRLADLLDDGWSLLIFPEGGRSPDGWGQNHRAGAAWLATRTGRPLVPVHLEGTRVILPRRATRLRPGTTQVTFGSAIRPRPGDDARALADRVEQAVAALADEQTTDWWTARRRAAARTTPSLTGPEAAGAWRRTWALGPSRRARRDRAHEHRWPSP